MWRPIQLVLPVAAALFLLTPTCGTAQTVRFLTSVGAFDMRLNPTGNANLQGHVDNLVAYVGSGRYHAGVINRAAEDFVLQLGGFMGSGVSIDTIPSDGFAPADKFNDVIVDSNNDGQVDFDTAGLTNSRGTVSLALAAGDANSGTSSFFVNLGDNAFLDNQSFVPFAVIDNMATIDRIMALNQVDLSSQVGQPGSLAYTDVPLTDEGELVTIESVTVISASSFAFEGPIRFAAGLPPSPAAASLSATPLGSLDAATLLNAPPVGSSPIAAGTSAAPEPGSLLLLLSAGALLAGRSRP